MTLPNIVSRFVRGKSSLDRLQQFLTCEEVQQTNGPNAEHAVQVVNGHFKWKEVNGITLHNISIRKCLRSSVVFKTTDDLNVFIGVDMEINKGSCVAIVGSVGSGKSALLLSLLGDLPLVSGSLHLHGTTSLASQQPWIVNASLKDNILFGKPFDSERYEEVLRVCELKEDISRLPNGDLTEIGERGINLSGGQRQRISLARCVYSRSDIVLLDDCLAAVDVHVGERIMKNCIEGSLKHTTRIVATHQLQYRVIGKITQPSLRHLFQMPQ